MSLERTGDSPSKGAKKAPKKGLKITNVRTRTPRPDELTRETFEFITAIDEYKRKHLRSFLGDEEVLLVLHALGYMRTDESRAGVDAELEDFEDARDRYRVDAGRLFPSWSEIFELLLGLGYVRDGAGTGDAA